MKDKLLNNDNANVNLVMTPVILGLLCDSPVCLLCLCRWVISATGNT